MRQAYKQAEMAFDEGEIPVGAIVVVDNQIIARAYNQTEKLKDVTAHAEMLAITSASGFLGAKYLSQCTLYVSLEPCIMCAGAIAWAQVQTLVFGAYDSKKGFTTYQKQENSTANIQILHPKTNIISGILEKECSEIMRIFFQKLRN